MVSNPAAKSVKRPEPRQVDTAPMRDKPVLIWAVIGVFFVGLVVYIQGSWLLTTAHPIGTGVTPLPVWMKVTIRLNEVVMGAGILWLFYKFVIKPKRETGRFSFDGLMFLGFIFCWWQDPLFNYIAPGFSYNAYFINLGGWAEHIPGWNSPNANNMPEPLIWDLGFYLFISVGGVVLLSNAMRRLKARKPEWGHLRILVCCFIAVFVIDFLLETMWIRTGCYVYGGTIGSWSLFNDGYGKFPIYESIGAGLVYTSWCALRYFVDDKGQTIAERGLDKIKVGQRQKTFIRFLAITGALNVLFLAFYSVPIQIWQVHPGTYPTAVQERSYYMDEVCGAGTDYACPGPDVPISRRCDSFHMGPDGKLRGPGVTGPVAPPLRTTP
jgi:hypothetical protein